MSIQDRLKMIMKMNDLNASSFADKVGVQRSSVSHILSGRNKPSLDFIQKTLNTFPRVSGDWLVGGKQPANGISKSPLKEEKVGASTIDKKLEVPKVAREQKNTATKTVDKIVYFYSDGSFKEYLPSSEE